MQVIDRKFKILAVNPANGNVYTDRDGFFVCAKDISAPDALVAIIKRCALEGANAEHITSLELLLGRVLAFQREMGGGRVPDTVGAELPRCLDGIGVD